MWFNSIGARVKRVINERVKAAQEEHDEKCAYLDEMCENTITRARKMRDESKEDHATEMVQKIIGRM